MRYGQNELEIALAFTSHDDEKIKNMQVKARETIKTLLGDNHLGAVVFRDLEGTILPTVAGAPEVSVPFGIYNSSPAGATFFMSPHEDIKLLQLAYAFEQQTRLRQIPNK